MNYRKQQQQFKEQIKELDDLKEIRERINKERKEQLTFNFEHIREQLIENIIKELNADQKFDTNLWNIYDKSVSSKSDHFLFTTFDNWKRNDIETFVGVSIIKTDPMIVRIGNSPAEFCVNENTIEEVSEMLYEQFKEKFTSLYGFYIKKEEMI